jgi:phage terminase large subunit-like protein
MPRQLDQLMPLYAAALKASDRDELRRLCREDLFFLLAFVCGRADMRKQWVLERCDEVQTDPDWRLDLWAREHFKSSIISIGKTIQDILCDQEITIGIFSHTRPIAKGFMRAIKREFEGNSILRGLFDDILWDNPGKEAPTWSEDNGLIVRRSSNPKESTIEAWGLVDGQPTGKHFGLLVFDDVVTRENAASPEMRSKVLEAYEQSINLGSRGGAMRMIGTRYHSSDAYAEIMKRETFRPRIHRAVDDKGDPVLLTKDELEKKKRDLGSFVYSSQMMQDPKAEGSFGFKEEQLRYYSGGAVGNTYLIVDPANVKKKQSDYTAIWAITLSADQNYYVRWMLRDKLDLPQRIKRVLWAHKEFKPRRVGYEQYGAQADIQALKMEQERIAYRFDVVELGGQLSKPDRIMGLLPTIEAGRWYFPSTLYVDVEWGGSGEKVDMVRTYLVDEFRDWPYSTHDDMLDAQARILDPELGAVFPKAVNDDAYQRPKKLSAVRRGGWMTM